MSDLTAFNFHGHSVRVIPDEHGEPWWIAADVCLVLGLSNVGQALAQLDDDERSSIIIADGTPGNPNRAIISESGLYSLVLRSRKDEAREFKRWIVREVLPAIRKTGTYGTPALTGKELLARAVLEASATIAAQEQEIAALAPKAEYVDRFVADEDLRLLRNVAKSIGIQESALRNALMTHRWVYSETQTRWSHSKQEKVTDTRYSAFADKSAYFRPVPNHEAPRFKGEVMHTLKITPAGASAIARMADRWGIAKSTVEARS